MRRFISVSMDHGLFPPSQVQRSRHWCPQPQWAGRYRSKGLYTVLSIVYCTGVSSSCMWFHHLICGCWTFFICSFKSPKKIKSEWQSQQKTHSNHKLPIETTIPYHVISLKDTCLMLYLPDLFSIVVVVFVNLVKLIYCKYSGAAFIDWTVAFVDAYCTWLVERLDFLWT